jgi:hypothetical protein
VPMPQSVQSQVDQTWYRQPLGVGLLLTFGYVALSSATAVAGALGAVAGRPWADYLRTFSLDSAVFGRGLLRPFFGGTSLGQPGLSGEVARGQLLTDARWVICSCVLNAVLIWLLLAFQLRRRARPQRQVR